MRYSRLLPLAALAACAPPVVPPPAPVQLTSALSPARVIQTAAQTLTLDGFTVSAADAAGGVVSATLQKVGPGDWGPLVTCRLGPDAIGRVDATMTLTARVSAIPRDSGSAVVIAAQAMTIYGPNSFIARNPLGGNRSDDTACVSSGVAERHIAEALTK